MNEIPRAIEGGTKGVVPGPFGLAPPARGTPSAPGRFK